MSQPVKDEELNLFFDEELDAADAQRVATEVQASAEAQAELQKMGALRKAMEDSASDWAKQVDTEALFAGVQEGLQEAKNQPGLRVIKGGNERSKAGAGFAVGLAAAAAVALAVFAWPKSDQGPSPQIAPPAPVQAAIASRGTEVVEVDFGQNTGTVFAIEGAVGQPLAVVWITEDEVGFP